MQGRKPKELANDIKRQIYLDYDNQTKVVDILKKYNLSRHMLYRLLHERTNKNYSVTVTFYDTFGDFSVSAPNRYAAKVEATSIIQKAIKNLPVEVEFDVDCVEECDEFE